MRCLSPSSSCWTNNEADSEYKQPLGTCVHVALCRPWEGQWSWTAIRWAFVWPNWTHISNSETSKITNTSTKHLESHSHQSVFHFSKHWRMVWPWAEWGKGMDAGWGQAAAACLPRHPAPASPSKLPFINTPRKTLTGRVHRSGSRHVVTTWIKVYQSDGDDSQ